MSSQRGERDADSKTQEIRYQERNFLLNEILDWDIGIRLIIGIIHTYPEICENQIVFFLRIRLAPTRIPAAYFPAVSGNL